MRWDPEFANASFELGYWDRVEGRIIRVALGQLQYDRPDDETFRMLDEDGSPVSIPFHRVRQVWRNGQLIWNRDR